MTAPRISIIVPTANRANELATTLESLYAQDFPAGDYETLIVENGPETGARAVTSRAATAHPDHTTRFFYERIPGLLSGRHRGALEARGKILVFIDDDIDAAPGWLDAIAERFTDSDVSLIGGRNLPRFQSPEPGWLTRFWSQLPGGGKACGFLSLLDYGEEAREIDPNYIWGLNFSIRREVLFDLRGFHPDTYPDEMQHFQGDGETGLTLKVRSADIKGYYEPRMLVHHRVPAQRLTHSYFHQRAFFQGICDSYTEIRRTGGVSPAIEGRVGLDQEDNGPSIQTAVQFAHDAGYLCHQEAVRYSSDLLEWVLRHDYWDFTLPDLDSPRFKQLRNELPWRVS